MKKIKSNQRGQGLIEYIALTALVAIVSIAAVRVFGSKVQKRLNQVSSTFEHNLQIGMKYKSARDLPEGNGDNASDSENTNGNPAKPNFGGFRIPKSIF